MKIPKHLQWPGMTADQKKRVEALVKECRKEMSEAPVFDTKDAAVEAAVELSKTVIFSQPSVWKEPQDIGTKYAVVHTLLREEAQNAGYTEEVNEQKIFDLANGIKRDEPAAEEDQDIDEIEED